MIEHVLEGVLSCCDLCAAVQGLARVSKFIDSLQAAAQQAGQPSHAGGQGAGQPIISKEDAQRLLNTWGAAFKGWQGQVGMLAGGI